MPYDVEFKLLCASVLMFAYTLTHMRKQEWLSRAFILLPVKKLLFYYHFLRWQGWVGSKKYFESPTKCSSSRFFISWTTKSLPQIVSVNTVGSHKHSTSDTLMPDNRYSEKKKSAKPATTWMILKLNANRAKTRGKNGAVAVCVARKSARNVCLKAMWLYYRPSLSPSLGNKLNGRKGREDVVGRN